MHDSVKGRLEEYLRGGVSLPEMDEHLRNCDDCRKEVEAMRTQAALFRALKAPADVSPGPAFYARVMTRIENQARPSIWNLFGESVFAKRLAYASATFLVLLSSYLISSTSVQEELAGTPEVILAGHGMPEPVSMNPQRDREVVLVNLATWNGGDEQDYQ